MKEIPYKIVHNKYNMRSKKIFIDFRFLCKEFSKEIKPIFYIDAVNDEEEQFNNYINIITQDYLNQKFKMIKKYILKF